MCLLCQVNSSVVDISCWKKPTMITTDRYRLDLFNGRMAAVLLTSIYVTAIGDVTVAHLGTSEGRIMQVSCNVQSCSSMLYLLLSVSGLKRNYVFVIVQG